jgi:hypothetical protein
MKSDRSGDGATPGCPLCGKPVVPEYRPFCSQRCKLRDLAHWIGGDEPYVISGEPLVGLFDEDGEPLIGLEELVKETGGDSDTGNVVYADFTRKSARRKP